MCYKQKQFCKRKCNIGYHMVMRKHRHNIESGIDVESHLGTRIKRIQYQDM